MSECAHYILHLAYVYLLNRGGILYILNCSIFYDVVKYIIFSIEKARSKSAAGFLRADSFKRALVCQSVFGEEVVDARGECLERPATASRRLIGGKLFDSTLGVLAVLREGLVSEVELAILCEDELTDVESLLRRRQSADEPPFDGITLSGTKWTCLTLGAGQLSRDPVGCVLEIVCRSQCYLT